MDDDAMEVYAVPLYLDLDTSESALGSGNRNGVVIAPVRYVSLTE
jgi:hypothetical protein